MALRQRSLSLQLAEVYTHGASLLEVLPKRGRCSFVYNRCVMVLLSCCVSGKLGSCSHSITCWCCLPCDDAYYSSTTYLFALKYNDHIITTFVLNRYLYLGKMDQASDRHI